MGHLNRRRGPGLYNSSESVPTIRRFQINSEELYSIDEEGNISDAELHVEILDNPTANALSDELAIRQAVSSGVDLAGAIAMISPPGTPRTAWTEAVATEVALGQSAVRERQIDFLLQEEFSLGTSFLQEFLNLCGIGQTAIEVCDVRASVRDQYSNESSGESDVVVLYRAQGDADSVRRALLIEDKIDAAFQPDQATRYKRRGELGIPKLWSAYATCLVAPSAYIKEDHGFQYEAALEAISPLLSPDSAQRRQFKQKIIKTAIESQSLVGPKIEISKITEFRRRYYLAFQQFRAELESQNESFTLRDVDAPKPRAAWWGDTWYSFKGPGLNPRAYVNHKADRAYVDLTFPNTDKRDLEQNGPFDADMTVHQTGKSAALRLESPLIDQLADFSSQAALVSKAFQQVLRLVGYYKAHADLHRLGQ